jgi:hypothetical protein
MDHGLGVKASGTRTQQRDDARTELPAAPWGRNDQGTMQAEARNLLGHLGNRARSEDDPLRGRIMDKGDRHRVHAD